MPSPPSDNERSPIQIESKPFFLSRTGFSKFAALSGPLAILFFFIMLPGGAFLPPIKPSHTPEQVADHYRRHETGLKGGIALMTLVGFFFPMYTSAIGGQISRIPGVPQTVLNAQLLGGSLGGVFIALPAYFFATAVYRLDRSPELIQLLNDLSWIFFAMPFSSLLCQDLAFSYAILQDRRPEPLYPRWLAFLTSGLTLTFWPALGVHCVHHGAVAWDGGLSFWTAGVGGGILTSIISLYTWRAIERKDLPSDWEMGHGIEADKGLSRVEVEVLVEKLLKDRKVGEHSEKDSG